MSIIRVLPEQIANRIAAGEVIERSSSIVKELVENALDAGASSIEVEVRHGGKSLIRVADDGCGMDKQDARLAFQRHATSKITGLADLEGIASFGFRGEALPSIAAVSRTRLVTRPKNVPAGVEVVIEGGKLVSVKEHPCAPGTAIEVRDLYFNTPARRKFLKSDLTELGHIQDTVSHLALASLGVGFKLLADGKTVLDLPSVTDLLSRASAVLGEETGRWLLELEAERDGVRLWGLAGKPSQTRANRSGQSFFVNRRWVRSMPLSFALQAGYHGLLMHGRYPVAVLFLDVDLKRVDVNVHPAKQEVRISNEGEVAGFVKETVAARLKASSDLAPHLKRPAGNGRPQREYVMRDAAAPSGKPWAPLLESLAVSPQAVREQNRFHVTKILGQVHQTFIVAETEEGLMVLDQHAAHERVMFEALLRSLQSGKAERQALLLEEVLELHPRRVELFRQALPLLTKVGFEVEEFGERSFVIRAVPSVFGQANPVQALTTFLEEQEEGKGRSILDDQKEAVAALCACKQRSVKAREPLEPLAIRKLLESLSHCENPFTCPHGRPVFFTTSAADLEKQFKRV